MKNRWFEKRGMLLTLIFLHQHGKSNQKTISESLKITPDTLSKSVFPELINQQLITKKEQSDFPFSTDVELTEKGRKLASKLAEIEIFTYS
jgi:DNA-binding HxlR family transcriptional regulator